MGNSRWRRLIQPNLLIVAGFIVGQLFAARELTADYEVDARPTPVGIVLDAEILPDLEVPGSDIAGLPRYPAATRVEYRQTFEDELVVTEVEYLVIAEFEAVHDYYRNVFHTEGWTEADLEFHRGEWKFFVIRGSREALVEVEALGKLVEVEIDVSEPQGSSTAITDDP
jgi:hypothetical protein